MECDGRFLSEKMPKYVFSIFKFRELPIPIEFLLELLRNYVVDKDIFYSIDKNWRLFITNSI